MTRTLLRSTLLGVLVTAVWPTAEAAEAPCEAGDAPEPWWAAREIDRPIVCEGRLGGSDTVDSYMIRIPLSTQPPPALLHQIHVTVCSVTSGPSTTFLWMKVGYRTVLDVAQGKSPVFQPEQFVPMGQCRTTSAYMGSGLGNLGEWHIRIQGSGDLIRYGVTIP